VNATSLKARTVRGAIWSFAELALRKGVTGFTTLLLAWFLTPDDFGLVAMMAVFLAFSNILVDAGLSQALIRKGAVTTREYDTAFLSNVVIAVCVYGVLYFSAPFIAEFYDQPRLVDLLRVATLAVIFSAFSVVQRTALIRGLNFKLQMQVSLPAALASGFAAIMLAYYGVGVWALIAQLLIQALMTTLLYWRLAVIRPKFWFGWREFRDLFSFSGYLLLAQTINISFKYMYLIVIAKLFSADVVGLYYFAEKIKRLVVEQLVASIQAVTFPSLAKIQEEPGRLKYGYRQVMSVMNFVLFPVLIFLVALMDSIFNTLLPAKWADAAVYLQLMCLASLMYPVNAINVNLLKVKGRTDLVLYLGVFKKSLALGVFALTIRYGIVGILIGQIITSVVAYIPNSYYSKRLIDYSITEQLRDFLPLLLSTGLLGTTLWWLQNSLQWSSFTELVILSGVGIATYITLAYMMKATAFYLILDLLKIKSTPAVQKVRL
jgi:O-antigen/teichoic acid export membrane protein